MNWHVNWRVAIGGGSAPAAKNAEEADARPGQMRCRQFARPGEGPARPRS